MNAETAHRPLLWSERTGGGPFFVRLQTASDFGKKKARRGGGPGVQLPAVYFLNISRKKASMTWMSPMMRPHRVPGCVLPQ